MRKERLIKKLRQPEFWKAGAVAEAAWKIIPSSKRHLPYISTRAIKSFYKFSMYHVHHDDPVITPNMQWYTIVQI
jgi:hypothetical protein